MKIRFNKFEKVAGLFVGIAAGSCIVGMIGIAVKNGWLASKVSYQTELESADGVQIIRRQMQRFERTAAIFPFSRLHCRSLSTSFARPIS